jgi:hypothetical protein
MPDRPSINQLRGLYYLEFLYLGIRLNIIIIFWTPKATPKMRDDDVGELHETDKDDDNKSKIE